MRAEPSILHLDLDAFFAAVEQRDKPSLRGRPVVVGGIGPRGVVSTASYEARAFGARSAMPTHEARRRCPPGTAFLGGRFAAYRKTSAVVMALLREVSPVVEQVSVDEAYVDLAAGEGQDLSAEGVRLLAEELLERIEAETGGLTASAGIATSKMLAKIASDLEKPRGLVVVAPGRELDVLAPLHVRALGGVGPATAERLRTFGVETVAQLRRLALPDLVSIFGEAHGNGLHRLARAQDDRPVVVERETKSISAEETFETDVADRARLEAEIARLAEGVCRRLVAASAFARTVTVKVRHPDFSLQTRSATLRHATDQAGAVTDLATRLLHGVDISSGLRLIGVGVSGLTTHAQVELDLELAGLGRAEPAPEYEAVAARVEPASAGTVTEASSAAAWRTGADVVHAEHGTGWVWGSGRGRVTVRFEGPLTAPGPVRTFAVDDPQLSPADPPDWRAEADD